MVAGVVGAGAGWAVSGYVRSLESPDPPSMRDLVGRSASVAVAIPAGRFGSVYVRAEGRTHEYSATASADIPAGAHVTVTGAVGNGLVVAPVDSAPATRVLTEEDHAEA
jgi:membrane protein implicated in regulation of membrane protease activity